MDVKRRLGLLLTGTVLGTSILVSAPAFADDAQLQQQIDAMQRQLQAMQAQLAETKRQAKAAAQQAQQTQQAQQAAATGQQSAEYPGQHSARSVCRGCADPDQGATLVVRQHPCVDGRHVHRDGRRVASAQRERFGRQRSSI